MLAGVQGVHRDVSVPVIRGGDDYGLDIFARQNVIVVARGEGFVAVDFLHALQAAVVAVASCYQLYSGNGSSKLGVALAHTAGPNKSDLNIAVGRLHG
jgi:hypothetical protein